MNRFLTSLCLLVIPLMSAVARAQCGGDGEFCCSPGCTCDSQWLQQYFGICGPCGGNGEPICISGTECQPGLVNSAGLCFPEVGCGGAGELCCSPGCTCDSQWLQQYFGFCAPCGGNGEPICISGTECQPGLVNSAGLCFPDIGCGGDGELCCSPGCTCDSQWLQQYFGICGPCGGNGEPYCLSGAPCVSGQVNYNGICVTDGDCGTNGDFCCAPGCTCDAWLQPYFGICGPCGGNNEPMCITGQPCQSDLVVLDGLCGHSDNTECDEAGEQCCLQSDGSCTCSGPWLQQYFSICGACGGEGEGFCIDGAACKPGLTNLAGVCTACGADGQPACDSGAPCYPGLEEGTLGFCEAGTSCGGDGELCCSPGCTCDNVWLQQYFGICGPCGGNGEPYCISGTPCQPGMLNWGGICSPCDPCNTSCSGYDACHCDSCSAGCGPFYVDLWNPPPGDGSTSNPYSTVTAAVDAVGNCFKQIYIQSGSYPEVLTINKHVELINNGWSDVTIGQ